MSRSLLAFLWIPLLATAALAEDDLLAYEIDSYLDRHASPRERRENDAEPEDVWRFELRVGAWWPSVDAPISIEGQEVFDLAQPLSEEDPELAPYMRFTVDIAWFRIFFDYSGLPFGGIYVIDEQFSIGPSVFEANGQADVQFDFDQFRIVPAFRIFHRPAVQVHLLAMLGLQRLNGTITERGGDIATFDEVLPVPLLGVSATGRHGRFRWYVEALGLYVDRDWFNALVLDIRGEVGHAFTRWFSVRLGYRYATTETDFGGEIGVDLSSHGPYLQLVFEF